MNHARGTALRFTLPLMLLLGVSSCRQAVETPEDVVRASIERYGGRAFDRVAIEWSFRDVPFLMIRDDGIFRYQRTVRDDQGRLAVQVMENDGTWIEVNGQREEVDDAEKRRIETAVNSVVYLGFLPFRLDDPAVRLADLGTVQVGGQSYRKVQVTFDPEGGGRDWEDRFIYWFLEDEWTLDYFAYHEATDPPTTRFRAAVTQRQVGDLLVQDYENYTADPDIVEISDYDRLYEEGLLRAVSMVEFDDVTVGPPPERE